jgi:hypothetical protein
MRATANANPHVIGIGDRVVFIRAIVIMELDGSAVSALGVRSRKLSNIGRSPIRLGLVT